MSKSFADILAIARENVRKNPSLLKEDTEVVIERYLSGLVDETKEVFAEVKENNAIHLTDELSDIAWDFAVVLALCEYRGLIDESEDVLTHGHEKYTKRLPALMEASTKRWESIKKEQKVVLKEKHEKKYGV